MVIHHWVDDGTPGRGLKGVHIDFVFHLFPGAARAGAEACTMVAINQWIGEMRQEVVD